MQILLPPSEGKHAPATGLPADPAKLAVPGLNPARLQVRSALAALCEGPVDEAAAVLGLGERQRADIAVNTGLATAAAAPAESVYTGVLYDALDLPGLPPRARDRAHRQLLIFSGLWGAVRPGDRIPAYRCAVGVKLPGLGTAKPTGLAAFWRPHLRAHLSPVIGEEFVLDLRSGAYAAMWRPHGGFAAVRILHERVVAGRVTRSVVSHFNKATKGRLVADLLNGDVECADTADLVEALRDLKYTVEIDDAAKGIDVIVTEV